MHVAQKRHRILQIHFQITESHLVFALAQGMSQALAIPEAVAPISPTATGAAALHPRLPAMLQLAKVHSQIPAEAALSLAKQRVAEAMAYRRSR